MSKLIKKKPIQYVNNDSLEKALIQYKKEVRKAKREGVIKPPVPHYVAACIKHIAEKLASRPNFSGYSFREEMVGDGIENCLKYIDNYNPNTISKNKKGNNFGKKTRGPFPYFTQIIWCAFVQRIGKEEKQQYIKFKALEHSNVLEEILGDSETKQTGSQIYENMNDFIAEYEEKQERKKEKR